MLTLTCVVCADWHADTQMAPGNLASTLGALHHSPSHNQLPSKSVRKHMYTWAKKA